MEKVVRDHKDLLVWQKAKDLVKEIYKATAGFPNAERFNLTSQMQRAAVSIPSNIAEGYMRSSRKEYVYFLAIAAGSASELETLTILSFELEFLTKEQYDSINSKLSEIRRMLFAMRKKLSLNPKP
jgi:four helix bundle protein